MPKTTPSFLISDTEVRHRYSEDVSGETMVPDYVCRPKTIEEITDCLRWCHEESIGITPAGRQTNDTASSLAESGVSLVTDRMARIIDICEDRQVAVVEPGVILGDLKQKLKELNLFYPPDPTSENMASVGGTIATNASGARTYAYGPTSCWVQALEVVLPGGEVHHIQNPRTSKSTVGPVALSSPTNIWVGSEGVLGVVTKAYLKLLTGIPSAYAVMAFFPSMESLLNFASTVTKELPPSQRPRSLEFLDSACIDLIRGSGTYPMVPLSGQGACIFEIEYKPETGSDESLEFWLEVMDQCGALVDDCVVADNDSKIEMLRDLRHYVPATLNEWGSTAKSQGGRKVSTDWAVPLENLIVMFNEAEKLCLQYGFAPERTFRYAHLGNGHPHYNFVPKDAQELITCLELRRALSRLAVSLGGTVAGEHGIGKLRKDLLQMEERTIEHRLLKALKKELDPRGIMAPGNLL